LTNGKLLHDFSDTKGGLSDDIRCDKDGNIWSAGGWAPDPLFNGVAVLAPNGDVIGRIVLPETAAICASAATTTIGCSTALRPRFMRSM
jgi:sugar lactone lactonase YvrE